MQQLRQPPSPAPRAHLNCAIFLRHCWPTAPRLQRVVGNVLVLIPFPPSPFPLLLLPLLLLLLLLVVWKFEKIRFCFSWQRSTAQCPGSNILAASCDAGLTCFFRSTSLPHSSSFCLCFCLSLSVFPAEVAALVGW